MIVKNCVPRYWRHATARQTVRTGARGSVEAGTAAIPWSVVDTMLPSQRLESLPTRSLTQSTSLTPF